MKFNIICIKCDQKIKKNLNFRLLRFLRFFKNLKNLGFSKPFSSPAYTTKSDRTIIVNLQRFHTELIKHTCGWIAEQLHTILQIQHSFACDFMQHLANIELIMFSFCESIFADC